MLDNFPPLIQENSVYTVTFDSKLVSMSDAKN